MTSLGDGSKRGHSPIVRWRVSGICDEARDLSDRQRGGGLPQSEALAKQTPSQT